MAIISQETIQKILDGSDIVELIQGYFPLKRAGVNFVAVCPFHNEKTPSFNVNPSRQTFHCFGCQAGGDAIKFVMMYDNLPFPEAAKMLADRCGVMIQEEVLDPQELAKIRGRSELKRMQGSAADWFHRLLFKSRDAQPARDYLKSRGITMEVSRNWKFGFAPENQRSFFEWAQGAGFTVEQLVNGGLAKWRDENNPSRGAYSFFRHRLMFPVNDGMGEPIAFSGRVLSKDQRGGKYVNSPETGLFNKSKTFFGLDKSKRAIIQKKRAIVCEGQLDMIAAFEAGIQNVVAPLGTAFTKDHARILKRHTDEVVLCFDSDTAGLNAASKAFRVLAPAGILVRLALLPEGEDPDSLIQKEGIGALETILDASPEFFDFHIDRRGSALTQGPLRDRLNFAKDLSADIALIEDKMLQDSLISRVTVRLGVGEDDIRKLVRNAAVSRDRVEKAQVRRENISRARESGEKTPPETGANGESTQNSGSEGGEVSNRSVRLLIKALLSDPATRSSIVQYPVPEFFDFLTETELLSRIWRAQIDPASPATVNAFIGTLSPADQQILSKIMVEMSANVTPELAIECLKKLRRLSVQNQIAGIKSKMGAPGLPSEAVHLLSKQLLDLREQLHES